MFHRKGQKYKNFQTHWYQPPISALKAIAILLYKLYKLKAYTMKNTHIRAIPTKFVL